MDTNNIPLGWVFLPLAFALGALHALEPGHGKTLSSAYLIGGKHDWRDALLLGLATTFSHTFVIVLLAAASLWLEGAFSAEQTTHIVSLIGGILLVGVGTWSAWRAVKSLQHGHIHGHSHHHQNGGTQGGRWSLVTVGISNGLLPCPGALAALLFAISTGKIALGLVTVLAYSLGLALALTMIGVLAITAGKAAGKFIPGERALPWMPVLSSGIVLGAGIWMLARLLNWPNI